MLFVVSKALQPLFWPLNLALLALFVSFFLRCSERARRNLAAFAFVALFLASLPVLTAPLRRCWEGGYPTRSIDEYPTADAIVLLGGSVPETRRPRLQAEETSGARVLTAWRLYRARKAPTVLVSGGVKYLGNAGQERVEADDMSDLLVDLGVPPNGLMAENVSRTTYENAVECARRLLPLGKRRILLVTSALHLRRATGLFEHQGFEVIPVPNSQHALDFPLRARDFLPDTETLFLTTRWLKEVVGYGAYKLLGHI